MKATVIVPTYKRPVWLKRCLNSLLRQTKLPTEVIVVMRDSDRETHQAFNGMSIGWPHESVSLRAEYVNQPGFLPPLIKGKESASGDIVCFIDDDAEAHPDWLGRLLAHYGDRGIGAVGGRCINRRMNGEEYQYPSAKKNASRLSWYGRLETNMYRDLVSNLPQNATCLMGGNCSYRKDVLDRVRVDPLLERDAAQNWELDWGLQLRRMGYRMLFDPLAKVDHYSAEREIVGGRDRKNYDGLYWASHNTAYILLKHLPWFGKIGFCVYGNMVGTRMSWGMASIVISWLQGCDWLTTNSIKASFLGRTRGVQSYIKTLGRTEADRPFLSV
jgi:GT2 family glycosyltransferase